MQPNNFSAALARLTAGLSDGERAAVVDAAYEAIENRGRECEIPDAQWQLAQVLFWDGFEAALLAVASLSGPAATPHEEPPA